MSADGQSSSSAGAGCAAAIAVRSTEVVATLENPGIDGNQSVEPTEEHPVMPMAINRTTAATVEDRSLGNTMLIESSECPRPHTFIAGQPWQPQGSNRGGGKAP